MTADLLTALLDTCQDRGDSPALTSPRGKTITYREFGRRVLSTRDSLLAAGLADGDRMLFSVRPGPEGLVLALGAVAAGATVVFIDPGAGLELFGSRVALVQPRWAAAESLLYAASSWRPARGITRRRGLLLPDYAALPVRHLHSGRWLPGVPRKSLSARRLAGSVGRGVVVDRPEQDAVVVFTSGTTGEPKAVVHTRGSLGAGLGVLAARCAIGPDDTVHTDQFMLGLPALVAGARWTMPPYGFAPAADPIRFAAGLAGATHSFLVPADLVPVLAAIENGTVEPPMAEHATGDLAELVDGRIVLLGRAKDMIIRGKTNVYPGLYEPTIAGLLGVGAALLVGIPDELGDEEIVLAVTESDPESGRASEPGVESGAAAEPGVVKAGHARPGAATKPEAVAVRIGHPLAEIVAAALPGLIDASALPDRVVVVTAIPTSGRGHKPDRAALRELVG